MLFYQLMSVAIRSEMQHRISFLLLTLSYFLSTFVDILGIWVLVDRFQLIQGWTLPELALVYGIMHMSFASAECFARGFDKFGIMVKSGDFDRYLLRPVSTLTQVAAKEVQLMRIGRFLQGFVVFAFGFTALQIPFFSFTTLTMALSLFGTSCFFYALFVIQGAICFWSIESLELMNIATYGGLETGQYPISIYSRGFRLFFTFIVPLASVAYYPMATALHHETLPKYFALLLPAAGPLFLCLACQFWHLGVRRYQSTGS